MKRNCPNGHTNYIDGDIYCRECGVRLDIPDGDSDNWLNSLECDYLLCEAEHIDGDKYCWLCGMPVKKYESVDNSKQWLVADFADDYLKLNHNSNLNDDKNDDPNENQCEESPFLRKTCSNCLAEYIDGDKYCRYCGAPMGEPRFLNIVPALIYGPPPVKRTHTCAECAFSWEEELMNDMVEYCPKCGGFAPGYEKNDWDDVGWHDLDLDKKTSSEDGCVQTMDTGNEEAFVYNCFSLFDDDSILQ